MSPNHLKAHVKALTTLAEPRNYLQWRSLSKAENYIATQFEKSGLRVERQKYSAGQREYQNILASVGPADAARVIIGAHYDVCGNTPGADDNASGVAVMLELAGKVKELNPPLAHRLDFVAYCLEEPPFFATPNMGSAIHARLLMAAGVQIKIMLCLEMLGYYSDEAGSQKYPEENFRSIWPDRGDFILVAGKAGQEQVMDNVREKMQVAMKMSVYALSTATQVIGLDFSDHRNFWEYNLPAVMITDTAWFRNPHYHKITDTLETLNFVKMAEVGKGIYGVII